MKMSKIITITRTIEVPTEAVDPTGAKTAVENHKGVLSRGEGDNEIITEANIKATMDNLISPWQL